MTLTVQGSTWDLGKRGTNYVSRLLDLDRLEQTEPKDIEFFVIIDDLFSSAGPPNFDYILHCVHLGV